MGSQELMSFFQISGPCERCGEVTNVSYRGRWFHPECYDIELEESEPKC